MIGPARLLALDTGSPRVSVALTIDGALRAQREIEQSRSAEGLIGLLDECLAEAGLRPADLDALAVLRGPGSFTGLRVGLAVAMGLHQALDLAVAVLPTLQVLAAVASGDAPVLAVVDALRGEWFAQPFAPGMPPMPLAEARIVPAAHLDAFGAAAVVGFGVERLRTSLSAARLIEATGLAAHAARLAPHVAPAWDPALLCRPLYLREPAVTLPAR